MKRIFPFILIVMMMFAVAPAQAADNLSGAESVRIPNGGPTFWVQDVEQGDTVTLRFSDYPVGRTYSVYIGLLGNDFGRGYLVGTLDPPTPGFARTFDIPDDIHVERNLAVMIIDWSDNSHGYLVFANNSGWDSNQYLSFHSVAHSAAQTHGTSVEIFNGPTFWIHDVDLAAQTFTIQVNHNPGGANYQVLIGNNDADFEGYFVGTFGESDGYRFQRTYSIPNHMLDFYEIRVRAQSVQNENSGTTAFSVNEPWRVVNPWGFFDPIYTTGSSSYNTRSTPYTNILNVVNDGEVTLQAFNFPPDTELLVTMGPIGSQGINGIQIGVQNSGEGSFIATYGIPAQLAGSESIAIRLQSTTTAHFAYDFFQNSDNYAAAAAPGIVSNGDWSLPAGTYPYTTVIGIVAGDTVTLNGYNFTRNDTYTVRMGAYGTLAVGGEVVGTLNTNAGDSWSATFNIPASLAGASQIAIRFESQNSPYFSYNWFNNQNLP